ncbi:MAG: hypothetical protein M1820_010561 [Bogoriella megaspora]|nr:MAG: hypothetical protein M1820_010561 [Bogoriella megaspora]
MTTIAITPNSNPPPSSTPQRPSTAGLKVSPPQSRPMATIPQRAHSYLGTSPINRDGFYEHHRILKSGAMLKRTRKTKTWGTVYLVLRPNVLSIYKNSNQTNLRHQIHLSDITAVARQRDPKKKVQHIWGVFSPSRNFHFAGREEKDTAGWVETLRREARIDEQEEEILLSSPTRPSGPSHTGSYDPHTRNLASGYSSSDAEMGVAQPIRPEVLRTRTGNALTSRPHPPNRMSHSGFSWHDVGSYSDLSDTGIAGLSSSLSLNEQSPIPQHAPTSYAGTRPAMRRDASNMSNKAIAEAMIDEQRVVCSGWLYVLRSKGAVRQWRKTWVVLRRKCLALYKTSDEYEASLIVPVYSIIDAVDIDPVSKSKQYCLQIICEDRNYRFATTDEDALVRWLGAFKKLFAERKEARMQRIGPTK